MSEFYNPDKLMKHLKETEPFSIRIRKKERKRKMYYFFIGFCISAAILLSMFALSNLRKKKPVIEWYQNIDYCNVYLPDGSSIGGDCEVNMEDGYLRIEITGGGRG